MIIRINKNMRGFIDKNEKEKVPAIQYLAESAAHYFDAEKAGLVADFMSFLKENNLNPRRKNINVWTINYKGRMIASIEYYENEWWIGPATGFYKKEYIQERKDWKELYNECITNDEMKELIRKGLSIEPFCPGYYECKKRGENGGELFGKYYEGICGCGHIRIKNPTKEEFETTKKLILLLMDIRNDITALEKELKK